MHVRVPLRKAALFVTPPFSAVKTPLWCIIPSRPCFPVQRPSFYPANSLMAQCICELRERDIPEPYTLNPQPQPKLQNLNTSPKTLNPKPRSLNPTPELNQNLDTGPKPRIVDPQVRGSGPLLRSLSLSLWHKKALSKDCFLQACSRKGSDLETTRDTTTAAAMFYALEFILRDHSTYRNQENGVQLTCPPIRASHAEIRGSSNEMYGIDIPQPQALHPRD